MNLANLLNLTVKIGSIATLIVYLFFAGIVIRQINLMVRTFSSPHESNIKMIGWIHFIAAFIVLILALIW